MSNKPKPPTPRPKTDQVAAAAAQHTLQGGNQQPVTVTAQIQKYAGAIPHPDILERFDEVIPGTAAKIIKWAEDEQQHRRAMESQAQAANIDAQARQVAIAEYQMRGVFRSDMVGQVFGLIVCVACIAGAIWLAVMGQASVAIALSVIPTGAVIYAFRGNLFSRKPKEPASKSG